MVKVEIKMNKSKEVIEITGDRVDILDFEMNGVEHYQIRYFRKGFSKSVYIDKKDVKKIIKKQ